MEIESIRPNLLLALKRDDEGFLLYPDDWSQEIGALIARENNQEMSSEHWLVIAFIREYFETTEKIPEARYMLKHMKELWGKEKATRQYLYTLFPRGYGQSACKIAGMRLPKKLMLDV